MPERPVSQRGSAPRMVLAALKLYIPGRYGPISGPYQYSGAADGVVTNMDAIRHDLNSALRNARFDLIEWSTVRDTIIKRLWSPPEPESPVDARASQNPGTDGQAVVPSITFDDIPF